MSTGAQQPFQPPLPGAPTPLLPYQYPDGTMPHLPMQGMGQMTPPMNNLSSLFANLTQARGSGFGMGKVPGNLPGGQRPMGLNPLQR